MTTRSWCSDGLLELLQSGQLNDVLRRLISVFHGARKEAVLVGGLGVFWWCTKSGKSETMLTSSCTPIVSDVIWKRDGYMLVKDLIHHGKAWLQSPFLKCWKSDVHSHCCYTVFPAVIPCDKSCPLPLNLLKAVNLILLVWIPYSCPVFQLWPD